MFRLFITLSVLMFPPFLLAHGVEQGDARFMQQVQGAEMLPFVYLGAKHMVTGYDHLLFLLGVIFFLYRLRDVALYVSLFALGHSLTLLYGVFSNIQINPWLIDAIIGLSVVYKALDNLRAFRVWLGVQPDTRWAVLMFGFCHGFGLATKLQEFTLPQAGLIQNMLAFNLGVELGQLLALSAILLLMNYWRKSRFFRKQASGANLILMAAGFVLTGYQLTGYLMS